ncbi:MAG: LysE family transporter [Bacteroidota bacterium]
MLFLMHILAGFFLSFVGSLPLGMINMTVADATIRKGLRAGLWVALGASLVEMVQAFASLEFSSLWMAGGGADYWIRILTLVLFFMLGLYFLLKKPTETSLEEKSEGKQRSRHFFKGVLISSLNVLAFPYWVFYGTYLRAEGWLGNLSHVLVFSLGVMLGTFALLLGYARMSLYIVEHSRQLALWADRFIGIVFLLLGIIQLARLL